MPGIAQGVSYYWQVTARDNSGLEVAGPVWRFTTNGDPPDLIVSALNTEPPGHIQPGQNVTLTAQIRNQGSGPVVNGFNVTLKADGAVIADFPVSNIIFAGGTIAVSCSWTYNSGNPSLEIAADSQSTVSETNELNNRWIALFSEVADNTAPAIVGTTPSNSAYIQQLQLIALTLADSQSAIDDAAVLSSLVVMDENQQPVAGSKSESNDTFTFIPGSLPLFDGAFQVSLIAADTLGNSQTISFTFTIDTQPPAKPVITGGTTSGGIIQPRPAQNTADQFTVNLTGTRDANTSVWINGVQFVSLASTSWSAQVNLQPGFNAFEVWLKDIAGNRGLSEWVDIQTVNAQSIVYEYNDAGRTSKIRVQSSEE